MNFFNPMQQRPFGPGMAQNEQFAPHAFPRPMPGMQTGGVLPGQPMPGPMMGGNDPAQQMPQMHTGGPMPAQGGYDSSGINPNGMFTGGAMPPMRLARMSGMGQGFGNRLGGLVR